MVQEGRGRQREKVGGIEADAAEEHDCELIVGILRIKWDA